MKSEKDLKFRIHEAGYNYREIADAIGHPYGTLTCWLNGFSALPDRARKEIESIISSKNKRIASKRDYKLLLEELVNDAETEGCEGCATISMAVLNKAKEMLGYDGLRG